MVVKQYLRFEKDGNCFGAIASSATPCVFVQLESGQNDQKRFVATACAEDIVIWDTKTNIKRLVISNAASLAQQQQHTAHVSTFAFNWSSEPLLAIGYTDGSIQIHNYREQKLKCTFTGHKSAVNVLAFSADGLQLASGGKDCEIVLWDLLHETGLFRLRGHRGQITKLVFMRERSNILISSSKDMLIKFWELGTQHCFKTLFGHKSEIWDFVLFRNDKRLVTGSNDMRVFKIVFNDADEAESDTEEVDSGLIFDNEEELEIQKEEENESLLRIKYMGNILRASSTRLVSLAIDSEERLLTCNGNDSFVECFKLRTSDEVRAHFQKKLRKMKRKFDKNTEDNQKSDLALVDDQLTHLKIGIKDEFERLDPLQTTGVARYAHILTQPKDEFRLAILLNNNSFEVHKYSLIYQKSERLQSIEKQGHRTIIQAIAVSSCNSMIVSASKDSLKVWNRSTRSCFSTINRIEQPTCVLFVPGDRFCIIGTKKGSIQILNIGSSEIVETISVSENGEPVTSIYSYPNEKGIVTGGEDKRIRFWDYELVNDPQHGKRLSLTLEREMTVDDGVICVKISHDMKLIAVSLLDSTVRIFYMDSLRFFLSLYGHKFPVTCLDMSTDCTLIATGSPDKNIRIWGLDFGDCHKSIFAHDEQINDLCFCANTHYFFTCSRDQTIKQWDADTFEKIITLRGHESAVSHLALTSDANFLISAGRDATIRIWKKTDKILSIEDELETEREVEYEKEAFRNEENIVPGETNKETGLPSYKTTETAKSTEKLIEAIDVFLDELHKLEQFNREREKAEKDGSALPTRPAVNVLFQLYRTDCPYRYMIETIKSIRSSELEECLLCLPFSYVIKFIPIITKLFEKNFEIELLCRTACFLARLHIGQIIANHQLAGVIKKLRDITITKITNLRDIAGYNLASLQHVQNQLMAEDECTLFSEAFNRSKDKRKKKKKSDGIYMISLH